jgi:hypothetical protein
VLHAELLALRHQLLVLQRSSRDRRPRLQIWYRALWVCLSRLWPGWRSALLIVKPETVIAWHRRGFRLYWTWKSRTGPGPPRVLSEVRELIRNSNLARLASWDTAIATKGAYLDCFCRIERLGPSRSQGQKSHGCFQIGHMNYPQIGHARE